MVQMLARVTCIAAVLLQFFLIFFCFFIIFFIQALAGLTCICAGLLEGQEDPWLDGWVQIGLALLGKFGATAR